MMPTCINVMTKQKPQNKILNQEQMAQEKLKGLTVFPWGQNQISFTFGLCKRYNSWA